MTHIEEKIGYAFKNPLLLTQALTHKSFHNENRERSLGHNERLEFLGDAVLDLCLSQILMQTYPNDSEGGLSKKRASLVNEELLSQIALDLKLDHKLRLGKGENLTGGGQKPRLLASALEAVIGALFMDAGYEVALTFIQKLYDEKVAALGSEIDFVKDFKTRLQETIQKKMRTIPTYEIIKEDGPPHSRTFIISVKVNDQVLGMGLGASKKQAEQDAARKALETQLEAHNG